MTSHEKLLSVSVVIELICIAYYTYTTWWGKTRPKPASWLGWTVIGALGTWISYREHAGLAVYINALFVVATLTTFISGVLLHFMRPQLEEDKANPTDLPLLIGGIILTAIWALQIGPPNAYATAVWLADSCFAWFTLSHAWHKPNEENLLAWTGAVVVAYIGTRVLGNNSYAAESYTWYILIGNGLIAGALWFRLLQKKFLILFAGNPRAKKPRSKRV